MRRFIKGILAGTVVGVLAGVMMRPSRKPAWQDLMNLDDAGEQLGKRTGRVVKGMARSMDRFMK